MSARSMSAVVRMVALTVLAGSLALFMQPAHAADADNVSITLIDTAGNPVADSAGVRFYYDSPGVSPEYPELQAKGNGVFSFHVPPGDWMLHVLDPFQTDQLTRRPPAPFVFTAPATGTFTKTLSFNRPNIKGVVKNEEGDVVEGANVRGGDWVQETENSSYFRDLDSTTTDAQGRFALYLTPGEARFSLLVRHYLSDVDTLTEYEADKDVTPPAAGFVQTTNLTLKERNGAGPFRLSATAPRAAENVVELGSTLEITGRGRSGGQASISLDIVSWKDASGGTLAEPRVRTVAMPLVEESGNTYRADWPIEEGTTAILGLTGDLRRTTAQGEKVEHADAGLPATGVSGTIDLTVQVPDGQSYPGGYVVASDVETYRGGGTPIPAGTTAGDVIRVPVAGPASYDLRLDTDGVPVKSTLSDVAVEPGKTVTASIATSQPATVNVTFTGDTDLLRPGAWDNRPVLSVRGAQQGFETTDLYPGQTTAILPGFASGQDAEISVSLPSDVPMRTVESKTLRLEPGENQATIALEALAPATLSGTLTAPSGRPAARAKVTLVQEVDGRGWTFTGSADADGNYSVAALKAPAQVTLAFRDENISQEVDLTDGAVADHDETFTEPDGYLVELDLRLKVDGADSPTPIKIDYRTAAHAGPISVNGVPDYSGWSQTRDNTKVVFGRPGDDVTICANGYEFGLPSRFECDTVTLPEDGTEIPVAHIILGADAQIKATVEGADGNPAGWWQAVLVRTSDGAVTNFGGYGVDLKIEVPEAGTYDLSVTADSGGANAHQVVELATGQTVELGTLALRGQRFGQGSLINVTETTVGPGGSVPVSIDLVNKGVAATDASLLLVIPKGASIDPASVVVGTTPVDATASATGVEVPIGEIAANGSVRVNYTLNVQSTPESGRVLAKASVTAGGTTETLTPKVITVADVTLDAPAVTATRAVKPSGYARPGTTVQILDGETVIGAATAGPGGLWRTSVELAERGTEANHLLRARVGDDYSAPVVVRLDETEPTVTKVTISNYGYDEWDGREFSWNPSEGQARFPFVFVPGQPMDIEVTFSNPERVSDVYAHLGPYEKLATWDETSRTFRAQLLYVREMGAIAFDYRILPVVTDLSRPFDEDAEINGMLPYSYGLQSSAEQDVTIDGSEGASATVSGPAIPEGGMKVTVVSKQTTYTPSQADLDAVGESGIEIWGLAEQFADLDEEGGAPFQQAGGGFEARVFVPASVVDGVSQGAAPRRAAARAGSPQPAYEINIQGDGTLPDLGALQGSSLLDQVNNLLAAVEFYETQPGCAGQTGEALASARARLELLQKNLPNAEKASIGVRLAVMVAGRSYKKLGKAIYDLSHTVERIQVSRAVKEIKAIILEADGKSRRPECPKPPPSAGGGGANNDPGDDKQSPRGYSPAGYAKGAIDPAGYVFAGPESNRLKGVTATLLRAETADGPWAPWDAEEYAQVNPLTTDEEGRYAWFVPSGFYQVIYEADGYEPGRSDVLEVAPPHFDVNVGLVPLAKPRLAEATAPAADDVRLTFDQYMDASWLTADNVTVTDAATGQPIPGSIAAISPESGRGGVPLAKEFRFTPAAQSGQERSVMVTVKPVVPNFAGTPIGPDATQWATVPAGTAEPDPDQDPDPEPEPLDPDDPGPTTVVNTGPPTILGTPKVGVALTATGGTWTPADAALAFQWLGDDEPISGATAATYTPAPGDVGKRLSVKVTATKGSLTAGEATSEKTAPVAQADGGDGGGGNNGGGGNGGGKDNAVCAAAQAELGSATTTASSAQKKVAKLTAKVKKLKKKGQKAKAKKIKKGKLKKAKAALRSARGVQSAAQGKVTATC